MNFLEDRNKSQKRTVKLKDILPKYSVKEGIKLVEQASNWLNRQEYSKYPFVPAGLETLEPELINEIHKAVKRQWKVMEESKLPGKYEFEMKQIFAENFPFWCPPKYQKEDFRLGDRVANICS